MLPNDKIVRKVMLGDGAELRRGGAGEGRDRDRHEHRPTRRGTRSLAEALAPRGIDVVDAPVMGGVVFAKDATLDIMVGGDAALVERVKPVLDAIGPQRDPLRRRRQRRTR